MKNRSNFNTSIYIKSLELALPDQTVISYDTDPLALQINSFVIPPDGSLQLSFFVDDSDVQFNALHTINTEIVVENNIGDKFLHNISFLLLLTEKNQLFKILTEKTSSLSQLKE